MVSFFFPSLLLPSHTCSVWPVFHSYTWPHSYHSRLCQSNSQLSAPGSLPWVLSLVIKACFANPCGRPEVPRNLNFPGAALNKRQFTRLLNRTIWRMCCSLSGESPCSWVPMSGPAPDKTVWKSFHNNLYRSTRFFFSDYFLTAPILLMNLDCFQFLVFVAYATRNISSCNCAPHLAIIYSSSLWKRVIWDSFKVGDYCNHVKESKKEQWN